MSNLSSLQRYILQLRLPPLPRLSKRWSSLPNWYGWPLFSIPQFWYNLSSSLLIILSMKVSWESRAWSCCYDAVFVAKEVYIYRGGSRHSDFWNIRIVKNPKRRAVTGTKFERVHINTRFEAAFLNWIFLVRFKPHNINLINSNCMLQWACTETKYFNK